MAMVLVWNLNEIHITGPHAIYVKSFQKQENGILKGQYIFDCINSWGRLDKTPLIHQREIRDLYYVSLYSDTVKAGAGVPKPSGGQKSGGGPGPQQDGGQGGNINIKISGKGHSISGGNKISGDHTVNMNKYYGKQ